MAKHWIAWKRKQKKNTKFFCQLKTHTLYSVHTIHVLHCYVQRVFCVVISVSILYLLISRTYTFHCGVECSITITCLHVGNVLKWFSFYCPSTVKRADNDDETTMMKLMMTTMRWTGWYTFDELLRRQPFFSHFSSFYSMAHQHHLLSVYILSILMSFCCLICIQSSLVVWCIAHINRSHHKLND